MRKSVNAVTHHPESARYPRALAVHVLARVSDDPAGAWRDRDPAVIARLAELELRSVGLRPPR